MAATALKDYYKTLDILPEATTAEVKKAYRAMAFKYHPDTAQQHDAFAESYFRDVQEAYNILGDDDKRKQYDNERWLAGMTDRARRQPQASPMWILQEAIKLNNHMATVDVYRMNHKALQNYILQLLDNTHMTMLTRGEEPSVNEVIINMLLQATKDLRYIYMQPVAARLHALAGMDAALQATINQAVKARHNQALWEKRMPYVIAGVTMLLLLTMYLWVTK